jgi:2-oxoglutarate dehydrogenase E2 component (dihydrolipoamide succinyltransferase)
MSIAVELPALGESVVEGTVSRWLVKEGDRVAVDQPLVEITTDKVDAEIPSPVAGVVEKLLVPEGETVAVGTPLASIDPEGEAGATAGAATLATAPARAPAAPAQPAARAEPPALPAAGAPDAPRATPLARRMAEQEGLELGAIEASGPSGRVTKADVERERGKGARRPQAGAPPRPTAAASRPAQPAARRASDAPGSAGSAAARPAYLEYQLQQGDRVIPMSPLRRLVAEHMVVSKRVSPHVGTVAEIDLGGVVRVRDAHKASFRATHGFPLSFLPFVVHACVRALREYPALNASVLEDAIVEKKDIHVGIAVETEKGLVVPVVRHTDRLSLAGVAEAVEDLAHRARSKRLSPDELRGGSFTLSTPGRDGNLSGFAIINQPLVGILRMGEVVKRPVVRTVGGEDAIVIRPIMHLALSYDHRAVDGAPANGFLHRVRELLEEAEFDL